MYLIGNLFFGPEGSLGGCLCTRTPGLVGAESSSVDLQPNTVQAMGAAKLLWALALLSLAAPAISDPHYLVVFPAVIHHPSVEKFCVLLRSLPETVHLTVTLEMKIQNHTLLDKDVDNPGSYECTSFQVPAFVAEKRMSPYLLAEEEIANAHVLIRNGDSVSFDGRKKVLVKRSYTKNLMVLDKPFYKPEETVKFRIVRLDEEFKALGETIPFVELKDPNGNRIGQWVDVEPRHGIVDLSFPLASEAALGTYTLKMGEGWDNQREFSVEEYVIPTFEVFFKFPPLVTHLDEDIQIHVLGRYTYGKPVRGNVRLRLTRGMSFYFFERRVHQETLANIELDYTGQTDKAGCASFTIKAEDIHLSQKGYQNLVQLSAELEEEGTGVTISGSDTIAVATRAITAEFINLNPFYKRGVPYTGKMKFTVRQVPYKNQTVFLTVDLNNVETHLPYVTDENGEVHFSLDTTKWEDTLIALRGRHHIFNVTQGDISDLEAVRYEAFSWLKPFYSESNSFLEIQHVEEELPCEKDQEARVDYILDRKELGPDADFVDFYYVVVSKGKIVSSGQKQVPVGQDETLKGTFSLTLSTSSDLAPTAKLLVYAVFADGEVAADVDVFTIDKCFKHKVTLGFSQVEELPGSKVNLQIEAAPGALCSLRAVDKSVVLKENDTLTPEKVYRVPYYHSDTLIGARGFDYPLEDFEPYPCLPSEHRRQNQFMIAPWFQSQADVYGLLKELGMKVLTNTKVKKPVSCELPIAERRLLKSTPVLNDLSGIHLPMAVAVIESGPQTLDSGTTVEEKAKPRTYFPETWVWNLVPINEEGKATHSVTVPDTITDWNANAFCVADIGFGLSQPATLRVFKPFFVELVLPYSVVRGETLQLKATVFNYLKDCIQVRVHLLESQDVEVKPCPECHFTTCLCADEAKTFSWNVTATQLGQVNLSVTTEAEETQELCGNQISVAPARGRSDTVVKALLVKPEGVLEEETHNVFLCSSGDAVLDAFSLELPGDVVSGSGRATISTIGDIMGAALQNVDQLLQMPFGCGEQNIAKFVPNIFILQYLEKTNQVTAENKEKGTEYMKSGYQRQLLYKRDDGSYSAFGKRDSEGNTWLTAFVAKAFGQAKPYVYIDEKHVQDALQWLSQHQRPSGCFESVGRLFNNALKGGVEDDLSLTAYVTASLLEAHVEKNKEP
ncbi:alpha-2-macroglobulin-like protein 1 isoform X2 [Elgaria multicarinata webbii]|uniref:alpha-2-macroglobulin-like protein 1 isoform X2 n=1 Tax=Elgaria multicarinata webbii TaxID=159646 RepID=UPI002FCCD0F2